MNIIGNNSIYNVIQQLDIEVEYTKLCFKEILGNTKRPAPNPEPGSTFQVSNLGQDIQYF